MALVNMTQMLYDAYDNHYAVPAISYYNIEDVKTILKSCVKHSSPIILMSSTRTIDHIGLDNAVNIVRQEAEKVDIPVALHLDHAKNVDLVLSCIRAGYTSVMFDGSELDYKENVEKTKFLAKIARSLDITMEAEIGCVGMGEDGEDINEVITDPDDAKRFAEETGIDAVAIAIGTAHGMQKRDASIHYDVLDEVAKRINNPIVLHGSSGIKDEDFGKLIHTPICKVNIATRIKFAFVNAVEDFLKQGNRPKDTVDLFQIGMAAQEKEMDQIIKTLGCAGRA